MKIGCNWSKALQTLLEKKAIKIDYIKSGLFGNFNEEFEIMRSLNPILVHGLGYSENSGMSDIGVIDFKLARNIIGECGSPHYGFHLGIKYEDMYEGMTEEEIVKRMSSNIQIFKKNLEVPLLLENSADTPTDRQVYNLYPYSSPDRISKIILENDVFFLLDISHARLTAKYNKWDIKDYIRELPLERVKEIHVNGSGCDENGFPKDTHEAMKEEDFELLEWALKYTKPEIVTLEYCGVKNENYEEVITSLKTQLTQLKNIHI